MPRDKSESASIKCLLDTGDANLTHLDIYKKDIKYLLASTQGRGFITHSNDLLAQTKSGKNVMNLDAKDSLKIVEEVTEKHLAVMGSNGKVLVFAISELPEMKRGKGVMLQKYKDSNKLHAVKIINIEDISSQNIGGRRVTTKILEKSLGKRASVGINYK